MGSWKESLSLESRRTVVGFWRDACVVVDVGVVSVVDKEENDDDDDDDDDDGDAGDEWWWWWW